MCLLANLQPSKVPSTTKHGKLKKNVKLKDIPKSENRSKHLSSFAWNVCGQSQLTESLSYDQHHAQFTKLRYRLCLLYRHHASLQGPRKPEFQSSWWRKPCASQKLTQCMMWAVHKTGSGAPTCHQTRSARTQIQSSSSSSSSIP